MNMELKRGNLGYRNGWRNEDEDNYSLLREEAKANNWEITETTVGHCLTETRCKEGQWFFKTDSSG